MQDLRRLALAVTKFHTNYRPQKQTPQGSNFAKSRHSQHLRSKKTPYAKFGIPSTCSSEVSYKLSTPKTTPQGPNFAKSVLSAHLRSIRKFYAKFQVSRPSGLGCALSDQSVSFEFYIQSVSFKWAKREKSASIRDTRKLSQEPLALF